jgi:hypothetical protein
MAPSGITASTRYINPETTKIYWVPTIGSISAPSRAELNAGTNLVGENSASEGWSISAEQVATPDMGHLFTGSIPGRRTAEDSKLTMYASLNGVDARTLMPLGTAGYVVWLDGGDVAGYLMDVFPVRVASLGKMRSVEGSDAATIEITFSITSAPAENVSIPA